MHELTDIFECTQCGFCCHGETTVSLDPDDQEKMMAVLGIDREEVISKYWRVSGATIQMQTVSGHCIFYREGCTVYHGRPWRCRQWPLVPALMDDETNFMIIRDSCPGINQEISYHRFREILGRLIAEKKVSTSKE